MFERKSLERKEWKSKRASIPENRRKEAEDTAFLFLQKLAFNHKYILSYSSFSHEFSTKKINHYFCEKKKLLLPRVENDHLHVHFVDHLNDLVPNRLGIFEPSPSTSSEITFSQISVVIVPALAFDKEKHRLGYGKGYYDRLLHQLPQTCQFYGLGFKEQLSDNILPRAEHDIRLTHLILF